MLRALRRLLGFVLVLAAGVALGYALMQWLTAQQSEEALSDDEGAVRGQGIVDQVQARIRLAVEEGKRAAAEARAELEAEAYGPGAAEAEVVEAEEAII
jgi:hypothetical protein